MGSHRPERDHRTAQQKWDQMMVEAKQRGYLHLENVDGSLLSTLRGEWDYSKPNSPGRPETREVASDLTSGGVILLGTRNETPVEFKFQVTRLPSFPLGDQQILTTQSKKLALQPQAEKYNRRDVEEREARMVGKRTESWDMKRGSNQGLRDGFLYRLDRGGGLQWCEWCQYDEEYRPGAYLLNNKAITGRMLKVMKERIPGTGRYENVMMQVETAADHEYSRTRALMEIIASEHGTRSYTELMRGDEHQQMEGLEKRLFNYLQNIYLKKPCERSELAFQDSWSLLQEKKFGGCHGPSPRDRLRSRIYHLGRPEHSTLRQKFETLPYGWIDRLAADLKCEWDEYRLKMAEMVEELLEERVRGKQDLWEFTSPFPRPPSKPTLPEQPLPMSCVDPGMSTFSPFSNQRQRSFIFELIEREGGFQTTANSNRRI
jgi:hypothetical protein